MYDQNEEIDVFDVLNLTKSPLSPMFGSNKVAIKPIHISGNDGRS